MSDCADDRLRLSMAKGVERGVEMLLGGDFVAFGVASEQGILTRATD